MATRKASNNVINGFAQEIPWLIGGSADLAPSTKTLIDNSDYIEPGDYDNRDIAWGVRDMQCAQPAAEYIFTED